MKTDESERNTSKQDQLKPYLKYSGLGFQMIATLILAAYAGMKLDEYFQNKNPWYTIGLMLAGVLASMYMVIKSVTQK
ncbi:AtpZ/AtpI family protein [Adhaeribacter aquaticus]|uniref:AtpZ/AtpI family protein n=1 Tax=Adhaeribacter aquaticus TaxID=299567 RepID=UPI00047C7B1A|nr:AtpZ/AtpI family protein [Adhaeribacter aquaticus]